MVSREMRLRIESIAPETAGADHIDVKSATGGASLRECAAGMLAYKPRWARALFAARGWLAKCMGLRHDPPESGEEITAENIAFAPGERAGFFTVVRAREERFWAVEASDKHLRAWLVLFFDEPSQGPRRYHVGACVRYRNALGPIYFNLIRPFHHLIVAAMLKNAVRARP